MDSMTSVLTAKEIKDRKRMRESALSKHTLLQERLTKKLGKNPEELIEWDAPDFSFKTLRDKAQEALEESDTNVSSALGQLFRYGIQRVMFDAYKDVPVVYPDLVQFVSSKNRQDWYAPLYGAEPPLDVQFGAKYVDSRIKGLDIVLVNKKVGRLLSIERELFDFDQSGQITDRASKMGIRVAYKEETDVMYAIENATYTVALTNRPASYGVLSGITLPVADIALMNMVDPLGNKMLVMPSTLLVSPNDKFSGAMLLQSTLQPSVPGQATQTANTATSGTPGWTMTVNPLQGLYGLKVSRFLTAGAWYLMEPKTSIPFQEASPVEITQENPQSGSAFEQDIYRWKVRRLYNVIVLESRYIYKGN